MNLLRNIDLPGKLIVTWFSACSFMFGGWLVSYGLFKEVITHWYLLYTVGGLFILGGLLGIILGFILGFFGRPANMTLKETLRDQLNGLIYTLPAAGVGFVLTGWIGLTYWAVVKMNVLALLFVIGSWLISIGVMVLLVRYTKVAVINIYNRIKLVNFKKYKINIQFTE